MFKKYSILSFFLLATIFSQLSIQAQCRSERFMDKCATSLKDFKFIKAYQLENRKGGRNEYSYVFSKGSTYKVIICDENIKGNRMIVTLYDRNRKKIVSSYNKRTRKYYPSINYPCSATGVYYIKYEFEGNKARCAVNIIGFKKK